VQLLNFIPEDYIKRRLVRKANLLCALLAGVVAVTLGALFVILAVADERLESERERIDGLVAQTAEAVEEWHQFQADQAAVLEKAEQAARLLNPLPRSRVVAEVVRLLPGEVTLTELSIGEAAVQVFEAAPQANAKIPARSTAKTAVAKELTETKLHLLGLAPTDVELAHLIAALSNSPYFDQVELSFSEDQVVAERTLRRFEVLFRLSDEAARLSLGSKVAKGGRNSKEGRL